MDFEEALSENSEMAQEYASWHNEIDEPHRATKRVKIEPNEDATYLVNDKTNTQAFGVSLASHQQIPSLLTCNLDDGLPVIDSARSMSYIAPIFETMPRPTTDQPAN